MNTGQIYHLVSIICYVLSAVAFAFTIYLFFKFKILDAFNVLSGRKLKQDMNRLKHLSGSASEGGDEEPVISTSAKDKKKKKKKAEETEALLGLAQSGKPGKYDTEDWSENGSVSDTDELYQTEATEELYQTEATEELPKSVSDTDELDIVVTSASDTELL